MFFLLQYKTIIKAIFYSIIISFFLFTSNTSYAEDNKKNEKNEVFNSLDDFYKGYAAPDFGVFKFLGIEEKKITKPTNTKQFAAGLLNAVGNGNEITPGLAFEWAPFLDTYNFYKKSSEAQNNLLQLIRSFQLSFGTVGFESDEKNNISGVKGAFGIKVTPIDKSDPLNNFDFMDSLITKGNNLFDDLPLSPKVEKNVTEKLIHKFIELGNSLTTCEGEPLPEDEISELSYNMIIDEKFINLINKKNVSDLDVLSMKSSVLGGISVKIKEVSEVLADKTYKEAICLEGKKQIINPLIPNTFIYDLENFIIDYKIKAISDKTEREKVNKELSIFIENFKKNNWNADVWEIAAVGTAISTDSSWANLKRNSLGFYTSKSIGISNWGQIILQFLFNDFLLPETSLNVPLVDDYNLLFGSSILFGNYHQRFSLESSLSFNEKLKSNNEKVFENIIRLTAGFEFLIGDDTWFEIAGGFEAPCNELQKTSVLALGTLKYAFKTKPRFFTD